MGFFSRRREREEERRQKEEENARQEMLEELSKPWCQQKGHKHEYRDFPPYLTYSWDGSDDQGEIDIKEDYLCIYCGKVDTVTLESWTYKHYKKDEFFEDVEKYKERYKDFIQPRAIVKNMLYDAMRVDRQKLKIWDSLHMGEEPKKEEFHFRIEELKRKTTDDIGKKVEEERAKFIPELGYPRQV
jgi:hypothetical protein